MTDSVPGSLRGRRIAVGMSGGVDSSLAAALLVEAGASVSGLTMKIYGHGAATPSLPSGVSGDACYGPGEDEDIEACRDLCARLGIPYRVVDLSVEYERLVLGYFREAYRAGRTPNPCVLCNRDLKFGFMLDRARVMGDDFELFATGHYARVDLRDGVPLLRMAADSAKDQTYFLYRLTPSRLAGVVFPLGGFTKAETRAEARRLGLAAADRAESQDFVAGGYSALFGDEEPGDIVDEAGTVLGRHRGIVHYTIGQRRGIGVSAGPVPLYVSAIDAANNRIVVSRDASLFAGGLEGSDAVLHAPGLRAGFRALVRIRQNHRPAAASVTVGGDAALVRFDEPQRAVAPGQSAVFYDDDGRVLGGCVIERGLPPSA